MEWIPQNRGWIAKGQEITYLITRNGCGRCVLARYASAVASRAALDVAQTVILVSHPLKAQRIAEGYENDWGIDEWGLIPDEDGWESSAQLNEAPAGSFTTGPAVVRMKRPQPLINVTNLTRSTS